MNEAAEEQTVLVASAAEMKAHGERLGRAMRAGDVIALIGPLGAGKTTFAQGLAVGLDVPPDRHVASPTFALVNQHPGRVPFVHVDLYRIEQQDELNELGLEESYEQAAVALEWADRFPEIIPPDHLRVAISATAGGRALRIAAAGQRGRALANALLGRGAL